MADLKIESTISRDDIPKPREFQPSKYDPIYKSCKTLEKEEGIQIAAEYTGQQYPIKKGLDKRFPRYEFDCCERHNRYGELKIYIIRTR